MMLAPSNPVVSIGAMMALGDLSQAVRTSPAPVVGISPIIGGRALRGMAEQCLAAIGVPATATGVATHYASRTQDGLLDGWLVAPEDESAVAELAATGIQADAVPLLMSDPTAAAELAEAALRLADRCRR